jgi:hypothetical protein
MWSMTGAVGQPKMHRAQLSDCESNREAARRDTFCPAGGSAKPNPFDVTNLLRDGPLLQRSQMRFQTLNRALEFYFKLLGLWARDCFGYHVSLPVRK